MAADEYGTEVKVTFAEIGGKFDQIMQSVDTIKEKQEELDFIRQMYGIAAQQAAAGV